MRFDFDPEKSAKIKANPKRGIGFDEVIRLFATPYYSDQIWDDPQQHRAIGWIGGKLYTLIFEVRRDAEGEFYHLVTLWQSTTEERKLYVESS